MYTGKHGNLSQEENLETAMEPSNLIENYAAVAFQERQKLVVGHLPFGHFKKFAKPMFYFLLEAKRTAAK